MNSNKKTAISLRKAARTAGIGFLIMFPLGIFAILIIISNLIVPGDAATTVNNIKANELLFGIGIASFLIILALDVVVALALYVVLKPVNKNLSLLMAILRLLYTAIMGIGLIALALLFINAYSYGELIAYIFFIPHLFVLGYVIFKSGYIPRSLGILLIIASFCYLITLYGHFFIPKELYDPLNMIAMLPAAISEVSLGIWLLLKGAKIPEMNLDVEGT